jgi:hypothetical protein
MVDNEQLKDVIGRIKYERKLSQEEVAELFGTYKKNMYRLGTYQSGQI